MDTEAEVCLYNYILRVYLYEREREREGGGEREVQKKTSK